MIVIALIIIIAGLSAFFYPGFDQRERSRQGASNLQSWLLVARQSALRDQAPRGVRLLPDPNNPQLIRRVQYLEQPDDFTGGTIVSEDPTNVPPGLNPLQVLRYSGVDLTGGYYSDPNLWPVRERDMIQLYNSGVVHQILSPNPNANPSIKPDPPDATGRTNSGQIVLASPLPVRIDTPQRNYKIVRQPRVAGDETLEMPFDVAIDLSTNVDYSQSPQPAKDANGILFPSILCLRPMVPC
jgi:hypothetical protein